MADIKDQLIKDSYNYVLQSDVSTGVIYRIGGSIPINPIFSSGLTINSGFTYSNGTERNGYVLTTDGSGYAYWSPASAATPSSGVTSITVGNGLSANSSTGAVTIVFTGSTGTSGDFLPLSGGTVTGNTIFQSGLTATTISATTYYNLPPSTTITGGTYDYNYGVLTLGNSSGGTIDVSGFTSQKIILQKINLGTSLDLDTPIVLIRRLSNSINSGKFSNCSGWYIDYYFSITAGTDRREKILYRTQQNGVDFNPTTVLTDLINYTFADYNGYYINFYCETYINTSSVQSPPTEVNLTNTLFNSLQPRNYSDSHRRIVGNTKFVRDTLGSAFYTKPTTNSHSLISNNLTDNWINYYDTSTSQDILKQVYGILNDPSQMFYGQLSGKALSAITDTNLPWSGQNRQYVAQTTFVKSTHNFYKNYKVNINESCSFGYYNKTNRNNYYAEILYDIIGGSPSVISGHSTTDYYNSDAFGHFVDTYRVLTSGTTYTITTQNNFNDTRLNNLNYSVKSSKLRYVGGDFRQSFPILEVYPGYQDVYVLKLSYNTDLADSSEFINTLIPDYHITNCNSFGNYFESVIGTVSSYMANGSPYGNYLILQSNDEKMSHLAASPTFTYGSGSVSVDAIYKGHAFRPIIYPLNTDQISLEVPNNYLYSGNTVVPNKYNSQNYFNIFLNSVTNKRLRFIIKYPKLGKYDIKDIDLQESLIHSTNNKFSRLIVNGNIEDILYNTNSYNLKKNFRPNNVEVYLAFFDVNTLETSMIPNYKIVVVKSGNNEMFKLIKGEPSH